MTLRLPTFTAVLLAAVAAFGATFLVLRSGDAGAPSLVAPSTGSVALPSASTEERIAVYQRLVRDTPRSVDALVQLAGAYAQRVRETGDASLYVKADALLGRALQLAPDDAGALTSAGALALSRHDFAGGLRLAQRAHALAPDVVKPYGVIVDGLVELGRYREAGRVLQRYVDLQPSLSSYARVSYFRELHGDLPGAIAALRAAASAGGESAENVAYVQTLLGNLYFESGRLGRALLAYREAVARFGGYPAAEAGLARVQAARGDLAGAARRLRGVVARLPLPEHIVALGEIELAQGRVVAARRDLALVGAEQRLLAAAGVNTDVDLALFEAQHGSPAKAVRLARAAWAAAPSVRSADALGWALTRSGRPADGLVWARRALRLGSRDPLFALHAGLAAKLAAERSFPGALTPPNARSAAPRERTAMLRAQARRWLRRALALNPRFSPYYAPMARRALEAVS